MFRKLIFLFTLFFSLQSLAQTSYQAAIAIGGPGNDGGNSIISTSDGGFTITGYTSCSSCPSDMYIVRLDSANKLLWTRTIGGSNDDYGYSLTQTTDGGFAVSGYTSSYGAGGGGIYVIKVDSAGNLLWSETIDGQKGYSIAQTTDGGFVIAGYTQSCGICATRACIIRLNSLGGLKWSETIGGTSHDTACAVIQTTDGGFAIAGTTTSFGAGGNDAYMIKLDSTGNLQWAESIGGTQNDAAYSITQTYDGGYALAGSTSSYGAGGEDIYIIKLDLNGNLKWTRTLGGTSDDVATSIIESADRSLIVTGNTASAVSQLISKNDIYVAKLDSVGNLKWNNAIIGGTSYANSITQTKTGGFAIVGTTTFFGSGGNDLYMLLIDSLGHSCVNEDSVLGITSIDSGKVSLGGKINVLTSTTISIDTSSNDTGGAYALYCSNTGPTHASSLLLVENGVEIFPNPTQRDMTLRYSTQSPDPVSITITDISGKTIQAYTINEVQQGVNEYPIATATLAQGMYLIKISNAQKTFYQKFIKQ